FARAAVAQEEGAGGVRDVAELVRVDRDRIGIGKRLEGAEPLLGGPVVAQRGAELGGAAPGPVGLPGHRRGVPTVGGVRVDMEGDAQLLLGASPDLDDLVEPVDRALLGGAADAYAPHD